MFEDSLDLLAIDAGKPLEELDDRRAISRFSNSARTCTLVSEQPLPTDLPRDAFHGGTLAPVEHAGSVLRWPKEANVRAQLPSMVGAGSDRVTSPR